MSYLTKSEREGLEDIFLSIHTNDNKSLKLRRILTSLHYKLVPFFTYNLYKKIKTHTKQPKFPYFRAYLTKQKKNLSK